MRALLVLAVAFAPALALAQPGAVEPGAADWERRVVRCGGTGAPSLREAAGLVAVTRVATERAARREALRGCMAALRGVAIETGRTVGQALAGDARLAASIEGVVKRVRSSSEPRFFSDGGVELRLEVPLDGELSELLLAASLPLPGGGPGRGPPEAAGGSTSITGVLVDASGREVARALAPRILDESGAEVYGAFTLTARARRGGTAAYAADVAAARRTFAARLGGAPRVVPALRARGADVVVSAADADAIRGCPCLAEGRVVIATGARP